MFTIFMSPKSSLIGLTLMNSQDVTQIWQLALVKELQSNSKAEVQLSFGLGWQALSHETGSFLVQPGIISQ